MEVKTEDINDQLRAARDNGENLAQLLGLFAYFINHTPEGRAVGQEIERDWRATCERLRSEKKLVGADFSFAQWLREIQKELTLQRRNPRPEKKVKTVRAPKRRPLKFRGIKS